MLLLRRYTALLLDMNRTFMFESDRFGPDEDYYATYRAVGGYALEPERLLHFMQLGFEALMQAYHSPESWEDFPSVIETFRDHAQAPEEELPVLERVFAAHEIGRVVPPAHQAFLHSVAQPHHLGIVSNICARPSPWVDFLREADLLSLFKTIVFSSEGRTIKPSHALFHRALADLPPGATVLFAGDSLDRDIIPAKTLGMDTAWIAPPGSAHSAADIVVESLPDLALVTAHS
jgi:putative hydrolase of the HAD superfamily/5'-nucleotidase